MKHLFVSFTIGKKLKSFGFYEPCMKGVKDDAEYTTCGFSLTNLGNTHDYTLPLYQQVTDWLREKHGIEVTQVPSIEIEKGWFQFDITRETPHVEYFVSKKYYYEAYEKAILKAIKLIEK